ncbi:dTDP-4-dehydrorhamnose 3,5-epimerase [Candidatus Kuenenia sp.]|uniref:dTDP-4-dehydrorhamnose 3,5-epimerase n=1 Tax=Candidatus Kuenenia sp. TaxID=2499824 RepID=UPI0032203549
MIFTETKLKGAYIIEIERIEEERGFFARTFCRKEFESHGLNPNLVQCNISYNKKKGTLRGMHYQIAPHEEAKLISCIRGSIYDVIIDMRSDSLTYGQWMAFKLTAHGLPRTAYFKMLYVPESFAHGFQTLEDDTLVFYQMSEFYHPESARGIRWDDPMFAVQWPIHDKIISDKDKSYDNWVAKDKTR